MSKIRVSLRLLEQVIEIMECNDPGQQVIGHLRAAVDAAQPTDSAALRDAAIAELVRRKMTSGNSVPVERCIITAAEIAAIAQQEARND